ncbi:MAG: YfhO family protein [Candidatus Alcyoniella australis]|nr:YfhO family protein [Candidatus Alcyoniella australis]
MKPVGRSELLGVSGLLLLLIALFLSPLLIPGVMPSASGILHVWPTFEIDADYRPYNDLPSDLAVQHEPWTHYARQRLAQGELPLWNPHQAAGVPFIANMQSAVYSPLTWIVYLLGDRWGPVARAALILYLSGMLAFLHLRGLGLGPRPALVGMVGWTFGGALAHWLFWRSSLFGFLLPGSLYLTDRAFKRPDKLASCALLLAALVALGITAGHPERVMLCAVAAAANLVYRSLICGLPWRERGRAILGLVGGGLYGGLLSSAALLPFIQYSQNSVAWVSRAGGYAAGLLPKSAAVLLFAPDLYGNRGLWFSIDWSAPWTNDCEALNAVVGLALLMLAAIGLRRGRAGRWFYFALAVGAALLAYGVWPAWPLANQLPLLDRMALGRFSALLAYALVVLAVMALQDLAQGKYDPLSGPSLVRIGALFSVGALLVAWNLLNVDRFVRSPGIQTWWVGCAVLAALSAVICLWLLRGIGRNSGWAWVGLVVLVFLETGGRWAGFSPQVPDELYFPRTAAVEQLRAAAGRGRFAAVGLANPFAPNLATEYGLRDVKVYDNLEIMEYRVLFDERIEHFSTGQITQRFDLDALSVLGVQAVLAVNEDPATLATADASRLEPYYAGRGVFISRNPEALPRAFFVSAARQIASPADVFERDAQGLIARRAVLLQQAQPPLQPIPLESIDAVRWLRDTPELVQLEVDAPRRGWLVLLDSYFPDWCVLVDGEQATLLRANLAFRAVAIEAGRHVVRFEYRPRWVYLGLLLSALATLIWLAAAATCVLRGRRMTSGD